MSHVTWFILEVNYIQITNTWLTFSVSYSNGISFNSSSGHCKLHVLFVNTICTVFSKQINYASISGMVRRLLSIPRHIFFLFTPPVPPGASCLIWVLLFLLWYSNNFSSQMLKPELVTSVFSLFWGRASPWRTLSLLKNRTLLVCPVILSLKEMWEQSLFNDIWRS